ncbi:MAG: efflux transporter outer membrane subunit [Bryobacteraceae bacterium]|nr:efflux transporter outer membrane subunit [Bryobacteraceae bacterium]
MLAVALTAWWAAYGDPEMARLIERALKGNLDVKKAYARIAEARALSGDAKSKLQPSLNFNTSAQNLRGGFQQGVIRIPQSGAGAPQGGSFVAPFETGIFQGGLDTKWELDLWGSNRAAVAAAKADIGAETELARDAAVTVAAEVARAYVELRGFEERIGIVERSRDAQRELLELTRARADAGLASQLDVERQGVLLANTEATLPGLEAEREVRVNRLRVLTGDRTLRVEAARLRLDAPDVGDGIDAELLRRRPDVRAAEARIAAAAARTKQARTDLLPKITFSGLMGRQSTSVSGFSLGGGNFFSVGPQLQLPIFSGGRIRANIAVNEARVEQARAAFEQEVLAAFEEAENAITHYRQQRRRSEKLSAAAEAARRTLELARDVQQAGLEDFLTVLDAQRSLLDAEYQLSEARTRVLAESVMVYKAVAGGW